MGERVTIGRVDAWSSGKLLATGSCRLAAVPALFVGTGRMEHTCWTWLQEELGVRRRHALLAGSTRWRPLVPSAVAEGRFVCARSQGEQYPCGALTAPFTALDSRCAGSIGAECHGDGHECRGFLSGLPVPVSGRGIQVRHSFRPNYLLYCTMMLQGLDIRS